MMKKAAPQIKNVVNGSARSRIVLMSGAPGSGKSTLAQALADRLRFTLIERDIILDTYCQLARERGEHEYTKTDAIPQFFKLLRHLINEGLDLVIDGTLYAGISEKDMPDVCSGGLVVNAHTEADGTIDRFIEREKARNEGVIPEWVMPHTKKLEQIYERTASLLEMGMPAIVVDANDGYDPSLGKIVDWIAKEHKKLEG